MVFDRFFFYYFVKRRLFKAAEEISSPTTAEAADEADTDLPALPPKHKKVNIFGNIVLIRELFNINKKHRNKQTNKRSTILP